MLSFSRLLPRSAATLRRFSTALHDGALEGEQQIHHKLQEKFTPTQLQVQDVSGTSQRLLIKAAEANMCNRWLRLILCHNNC